MRSSPESYTRRNWLVPTTVCIKQCRTYITYNFLQFQFIIYYLLSLLYIIELHFIIYIVLSLLLCLYAKHRALRILFIPPLTEKIINISKIIMHLKYHQNVLKISPKMYQNTPKYYTKNSMNASTKCLKKLRTF